MGKGAHTQQTPGRGPLCSGQPWGLHRVMENMTEGAPASHRMSPACPPPGAPQAARLSSRSAQAPFPARQHSSFPTASAHRPSGSSTEPRLLTKFFAEAAGARKTTGLDEVPRPEQRADQMLSATSAKPRARSWGHGTYLSSPTGQTRNTDIRSPIG